MSRELNRETLNVGRTETDRQHNADLLSGYDYGQYTEALTGYTGQDLQRIASIRWRHAVRTRIGSRGNYKAGMAQLVDGRLVAAVCRATNDPDHANPPFVIDIYASEDTGLTWQEIGESPLIGKEPSLTALPDGSLVMTAQIMDSDAIPVSRSAHGGRTWETVMLPGDDYPRNLTVEPDGSLLMVRALRADWTSKGQGSPNLEIARSRDGGMTWVTSEGVVDWDWTAFGEASAVRLRDGRLLAALRRQIPDTWGEGFEDTVLTESVDDGQHWSLPWQLSEIAEVHVYLTVLSDGRILATYSNYHVPWGVFAVLSKDGGKTWDIDRPVQLAVSPDFYVGWPVTLQLPDGTLVTSYASTTYYRETPDRTTCEVVQWRLPD